MSSGCGQPAFSAHGQRPCARAETLASSEQLMTRTSWVDAAVAYREVKKGRARGNLRTLAIRKHLQRGFFVLGNFVQQHNGKVLILGALALSLCSVGLKSWRLETNLDKLWVADGGRLDKELNYTKTQLGVGYGLINPVVIQSPRQSDDNVLTRDSMNLHLRALTDAVGVEVNMYNLLWRFEDICFKPSFATFENNILDKVLPKMLPCVIITPLDCFWEGSKILGPSTPIRLPSSLGLEPVTWTTLDPQGLVEMLKLKFGVGDLDYLSDVMLRAGVTSGYQRKPCLNPRDPRCPLTSPNFGSRTVDVGATLTGGCTGFAAKRMLWPENLIVGGIRRNRSGSIVHAKALQSVLMLMGEQDLYDAYANDNRVSSTSWSVDKAAKVLSVWQQKFTDRMLALASNASSAAATGAGSGGSSGGSGSTLASFTELSLEDILVDFSVISYIRVGVGCGLMLIYTCLTFLRYDDAIRSQCGLGMAGLAIVVLTVAGALGFCSVVQIASNAATTQVIPFLALGVGISDIFHVAHTFNEVGSSTAAAVSHEHHTGETLKRVGPTVLLTSISKVSCAFLGVLIPVPALRAFALQLGVILLFNAFSILLLFPAACSVDVWRRKGRRIDVLCCLDSRTGGGGSGGGSSVSVHPLADAEAGSAALTEPCRRLSAASAPAAAAPPPYAGHVPLAWAAATEQSAWPPPPAPPRGRDTLTACSTVGRGGGRRAYTTLAPPPTRTLPPDYFSAAAVATSLPPSASGSGQNLTSSSGGEAAGVAASCCRRCSKSHRLACCSFTLQRMVRDYAAPFLQKPFTKACVILAGLAAACLGVYGITCIKDGMDLSEIVPRDTNEYSFLELQSQYFGFYNMHIVTKGDADYASREGQRLLRELHGSFSAVSSIVRDKNGSLPVLWLDVFVDWLQDLQKAVDSDAARGCFSPTRGSFRNSSAEGALGFLLLSQTGDPNEPVDNSRYARLRLVDSSGYVLPETFYHYLTAWSSNDITAYDLSQANLRPMPASWYYVPHEGGTIPRSANIAYAQMAFYLNSLGSAENIVGTIEQVRAICDKFTTAGLPSYPSGAPFTYWEQYTALRPRLALSLSLAFFWLFLVLAVTTGGAWLSAVVVTTLAVVLIELFGFMGLVGLRMSAVPAVVLVSSLGCSAQLLAHVAVAFATSVGRADVRMGRALEHSVPPVLHAGVAVAVGVTSLAGSDFDFIVRYFLYVVLAHVALCLLNGLFLLPVMLSLVGPPGDIGPLDPLADCISPPVVEASPKLTRRKPHQSPLPKQKPRAVRVYPRVPSEISLSTISEEPTQLSSHDIVIEPKVQVDTRTSGAASPATMSDRDAEDVCTSVVEHVCSAARVTTTIRATTTVKVEVHTSLPGSVYEVEHYQAKRKKRAQGSSDCPSDDEESQI